jgi:hypothetical protein
MNNMWNLTCSEFLHPHHGHSAPFAYFIQDINLAFDDLAQLGFFVKQDAENTQAEVHRL